MLTHSLLVHTPSMIVLKTVQSIMSFTKTEYQYIYKICLLETGSWYKLEVSPYLDEQDDLAIATADMIERSPADHSLVPVTASTADLIRNYYLGKTHDDNFMLFEYRGCTIWFGYNEDDNRGYYWVAGTDGEDFGLSEDTIKGAKDLIDYNIERGEDV